MAGKTGAAAPVKVVTVAQMQALEDASERAGVSKDTLMENAGLACARHIRKHLGAAGRRIVILTGPGNNGADGLVAARQLRRLGAEVCCYIVGGRPDADPKMDAARAGGVSVLDAAADPGLAGLDARLSQCDVVVDAILGAGRYRPPVGVVAAAIALVNRRRANDGRGWRIIALDLPTGVHPDTGVAAVDSIVADGTLALCCPKWGIAGFPGAGYAGRISVLEIGLPPAAMGAAGSLTADWMTPNLAAGLLPARPLDGHKGTFGHLLVIAGSRNYVGAAALACRAAHRAGAGLVTLAAPASIYPILAGKLDETIHLPLPEDAEGGVAADAAGVIRRRMGAYSALAVGCGMGQSGGAVEFMRRLLRSVNDREGGGRGDNDNRAARLPAVIDADGLNNLARNPDWPGLLGAPAVLTPHPGEMATLTGQATAAIQADRPAVAARYAAAWGQTVLLKGAYSIVTAPDGGQRILPFANPALAAGGAGDVLTGIIGGLLAQGLAAPDAAALGGYLHGAAGEQARRTMGEAGVIPSDLPDRLPALMRDLRTGDFRMEDWGDGGSY